MRPARIDWHRQIGPKHSWHWAELGLAILVIGTTLFMCAFKGLLSTYWTTVRPTHFGAMPEVGWAVLGLSLAMAIWSIVRLFRKQSVAFMMLWFAPFFLSGLPGSERDVARIDKEPILPFFAVLAFLGFVGFVVMSVGNVRSLPEVNPES